MKNKLMKILNLIVPLIAIIVLSACEGDYRPKSVGAMDEVIVVMDSTQWNSETATAIRETFGRQLETVPTYETEYHLVFRDFRNNKELEQLKEFKNVIFAGTLDSESNASRFIKSQLSEEVENRVRNEDSFAFPMPDRWVRDQWSLILTSVDDVALAQKIKSTEDQLVNNLLDREFERRKEEVFRRGEQVAIADSLWEDHGWKLRMQHDYVKAMDTSNVVMFRRYLERNNRWLWVWWEDGVENIDHIDSNWINTTRDSLMQIYVQGEREGSYLTTEYRRPVNTRELDLDGRLKGFETLGTWRMTNDFMGGPFVNFTYHDPATNRLFLVEYAQFAPDVNKRRFVRQFQAMGRTFESDSTWSQNADEQMTDNLSN